MRSLRAELLVNQAVLTAASIVFAVAAVVLLSEIIAPGERLAFLALIVIADVVVFFAFGAFLLQRLVAQPLSDAVAAAEAIAQGDLARRVPANGPAELHQLAESVNRMTDRLLDERAQLVRAEKLASVGRLAAGVAHEIGNPLGAINGYAHVLRVRAGGDPQSLEALFGLEREAARIDRIVRGLLDYARPRAPAPAAVDVNDAVRSVLELLRAQGALKYTTIAIELDPSMPVMRGDRHELEQVFVNLLLNALDALNDPAARARCVTIRTEAVRRTSLSQTATRRTPVPGDQPAIAHAPESRAALWAAAHSGEAAVKVVIADAGPGIPPADAERVFDPFYTTKEPGQGTGLGLAIVARIVDNLRGTIWVTPAREGGAAFHVLFPAAI